MKEKIDIWNELIKLRDTTQDGRVKHRCILLLSQLNTASGERIRGEIESFLKEHKIIKGTTSQLRKS